MFYAQVERSLENVRVLTSLARALTYASFIDYSKGKLSEDFSLDYLNDSLWKASRFNFDALVYDEVLDKILSLKDLILLMCEYSYEALKLFGDEDIISKVESMIKNGNECDEQIKVYNESGFDGLNLFLINNVDI